MPAIRYGPKFCIAIAPYTMRGLTFSSLAEKGSGKAASIKGGAMQNKTLSVSQTNNIHPRRRLAAKLKVCPPHQAAKLLTEEYVDAPLAFEALTELNPSFTQDILRALPDERRQAIIASATPEIARQ
jgi:hypothetical protein